METRKRSPQKAMEPAGQTKATQQGKAAQADKIEAFLADMAESNPELSQIWGAAFEKVPVAVLASMEFWGHLATWLVEVYVISEGDVNGGQHLGVGPAHAAWSGAIDSARKTVAKLKTADAAEHQARAWPARLCPARVVWPSRHAHRAQPAHEREHSRFSQAWFARLKDGGSDEGEWFANIKKNMKTMISARKARLGERFDHSAEDIFLKEVESLCAAYSLLNTADSASRKLSINTLWRGAGRPGEPKHLNYKTLRWNKGQGTPEIESFQSKPSKMKYAHGIHIPLHTYTIDST